MDFVDELIERLKPAIQEFQANPDSNPECAIMKKLVQRIVDEGDFTRVQAARMVGKMKIKMRSGDIETINKIVEFLFCGYQSVLTLCIHVCGQVDYEFMLEACDEITMDV